VVITSEVTSGGNLLGADSGKPKRYRAVYAHHNWDLHDGISKLSQNMGFRTQNSSSRCWISSQPPHGISSLWLFTFIQTCLILVVFSIWLVNCSDSPIIISIICQLSFLFLDGLIHYFAGQLELTMTLSYLKAGWLKQWLGQQDCPAFLWQCEVVFDKAFHKSSVNDCPAASAIGNSLVAFYPGGNESSL